MSPPPPRPAEPAAVQTLRWMLRPIAFMEDCRRRYGDCFTVCFLGAEKPMTLLSDPEAIKALYGGREHGLPPARSVPLQPLLGPRSVLLIEGEEHVARRKLLGPGFHGDRMRACEDGVREIVEREVGAWPEGRRLALHPAMRRITRAVILRSVFGIAEEERAQRLGGLLVDLLDGASSLPVNLRMILAHRVGAFDPLPRRLRELRDRIDRGLLAEIARRRADPRPGASDVMSLLVESRFEDGTRMEDREVRDQLVTLLLAGYETTAAALAWSFDLVLRHPDVVARLRSPEADEDYLRAVVRECLRLRPVLSFVGRRLGADLAVGPYVVPAGGNAAPAPWLTHTRADLYPDPYAFRPLRFLGRNPPAYGWFPFGGGVRRCLGAAFAELEMRVVLATALRERELRPLGGRSESISRQNLMLAPSRGTLVEVGGRCPVSRSPAQLAA